MPGSRVKPKKEKEEKKKFNKTAKKDNTTFKYIEGIIEMAHCENGIKKMFLFHLIYI